MTNGLILSFDHNSVKIATTLTATDTVVSYKLKGKKLIIAGRKFGVLTKTNKDSLVLVSNRNRNTTFRKIEPSLTETITVNLIESNWYLSDPTDKEFIQRMTFHDSASRQRGWKVCTVQTSGQRFKRQDICEWSLKEIGKDVIITVQNGFGGPQNYFQMTRASTDKFEIKSLSGTDNKGLLLEKSKCRRSKETLFDLVTAKTWKTESVLDYSTQSDEPVKYQETTIYFGQFISYEDTTLVELKELTERQLKFSFIKSNTFDIMRNEKLIQTGTWNFSADCEYIVLDSGLRPEDYIELIEANATSLTIGKQDKLKIGTDKGSTNYYYKLRLD